MQKEALLLLEDATYFRGYSFAGPVATVEDLTHAIAIQNLRRGVGELIFTTSMSGYVEYMTDPSYLGQIITATYPLIGNYGVDIQWSESSDEKKSDSIAPSGLIVHELYKGPVSHNRKTLEAWMSEQSVPGLERVDTRGLTKYIRDKGAKNAAILSLSHKDTNEIKKAVKILSDMPRMEGRNIVSQISSDWQEYNTQFDERCTVVVYNCGTKKNIINILRTKQCKVFVAPHSTSATEILARNPDMVLFSNGPGDPAVLDEEIALIRELHGKTVLCGICLGNQLLGLSLRAKTYKMSFGHHGSNHPVQNQLNKRLYITSQNHGFSLDEDSLPHGAKVWFRNTNDNTIEGFYYEKEHIYSVQFHPEACPGPVDSIEVFDFFIDKAIQFRKK